MRPNVKSHKDTHTRTQKCPPTHPDQSVWQLNRTLLDRKKKRKERINRPLATLKCQLLHLAFGLQSHMLSLGNQCTTSRQPGNDGKHRWLFICYIGLYVVPVVFKGNSFFESLLISRNWTSVAELGGGGSNKAPPFPMLLQKCKTERMNETSG